jgi:hypothetical protein
VLSLFAGMCAVIPAAGSAAAVAATSPGQAAAAGTFEPERARR